MPTPPSRERLDLEQKVLRLLCQTGIDPTSRYGISLALQPVHFRDPLNRTVYEEIRALGSVPHDRFRELLTARVNNRGVPDCDFEVLFAPETVHQGQLEDLARSVAVLKSLSQAEAGSSFAE